ncbi:hypothetical protein BKA56DRAFT_623381 [Ilyonectria sp. MPI-CAGE-AT-0026]|nr:hypothetical protein BKA56DRAFT_623381 [Ilyonectria sp. MPI-CAGE-AT-0026]
MILFTNQIGLGVLSLPSVMKIPGIVPRIIAIDCLTRGKKFEILTGIMNVIQFIFFSTSPAVSLSVAFNSISDHATCSVVFTFVSCAVFWTFCIPRMMKSVFMYDITNATSVLIVVGIASISLAVAGPAKAPAGWDRKIEIVGNPTFRESLNTCLKIVYAYAANFTSFLHGRNDQPVPGLQFLPHRPQAKQHFVFVFRTIETSKIDGYIQQMPLQIRVNLKLLGIAQSSPSQNRHHPYTTLVITEEPKVITPAEQSRQCMNSAA